MEARRPVGAGLRSAERGVRIGHLIGGLRVVMWVRDGSHRVHPLRLHTKSVQTHIFCTFKSQTLAIEGRLNMYDVLRKEIIDFSPTCTANESDLNVQKICAVPDLVCTRTLHPAVDQSKAWNMCTVIYFY